MIDIGCLSISPKKPFTYASGLKGPIYCDCRLLATHQKVREMIAQAFSDLINAKELSYDYITGVATAGIPHAAFLAAHRKESFCYSRSKPKAHGQGRMVEGDVADGSKLLLIEDLVNQGSSIATVIENLRQREFVVDSALCIVDYQTPKSLELLNNLKVESFSLINFRTLADVAHELKVIDDDDLEILDNWNKSPETFVG